MTNSKIVSIKKLQHFNGKKYDIETEKTHNFFANNMLVHNLSATYFIKDGEFGVCSRNLELKETESSTYWRLAKILNIEEKLKSLDKNLALQGEIYGIGIQRGYGLPNQYFNVYSVYDIDCQKYLNYSEAIALTEAIGLQFVPVLSEMILDHLIDDLLKIATRPSTLNVKFLAEGIVVRSIEEDTDPELGRLSFKVISNKSLLEET